MKTRSILACILTLSFILISLPTHATVDVVLLDELFSRGKGKPIPVTRNIDSDLPEARLIITNGASGHKRVTAAVIILNGNQICAENDLNNKVSELIIDDVDLDVNNPNIMEVLVKEPKGGAFSIQIVHVDVPAEAGAYVGPEEGVVEVTDPESPIYGAAVVIIEGALQQNTLITIRATELPAPLPTDMESIGATVNLTPDGLNYDRYIMVALPIPSYLNVESEPVGIAYFSTIIEEWKLLPPIGYDTENSRIIFLIDHFCNFQPVKLTTEDDDISIPFDVTKDSMTFNNDLVVLKNIDCVDPKSDVHGVCSGIAGFTRWYYEEERSLNDNHRLRCIYDSIPAANLSCDLHGDYKDWWSDFLNTFFSGSKILQLGGLFPGPVKWYMLRKLKEENNVPLFLNFHTDAKIIQNPEKEPIDKFLAHSVLVLGWTEGNGESGSFTVYDPNDNMSLHEIVYNGEFFSYEDHAFGENVQVNKIKPVVEYPKGIDFPSYYNNNIDYPKADQDSDGVGDNCGPDGYGCCDKCPDTPIGEPVNEKGCSAAQRDTDGDGYEGDNGTGEDCNDNDDTIHPAAQEICDSKDNDCNESTPDGSAEEWLDDPCDGLDSDLCLEGALVCSAGVQVCNDETGDNVETCDGIDNDCDGQVDEDLTTIFYQDADYDDFGDPENSIQDCLPPAGYVADNTDCNDADPNIYPNASEICDDQDNQCPGDPGYGEIDEGCGLPGPTPGPNVGDFVAIPMLTKPYKIAIESGGETALVLESIGELSRLNLLTREVTTIASGFDWLYPTTDQGSSFTATDLQVSPSGDFGMTP